MKKQLLLLLLLISTVKIISAQTQLIHYWSFNNFDSRLLGGVNPDSIAPIKADFSLLDTNNALLYYSKVPGTSTNYLTYWDNNSGSGDTSNARMGAGAGNGLRVRNPSDSMQLLLYVPTSGFQDIVIKFVTQGSSATKSSKTVHFDYSINGGSSWQTTGLSTLYDSVYYQQWHVSTVSLSNPQVNNNSNVIFRIKQGTPNSGTTGTVRYENITVEGQTYYYPKKYWSGTGNWNFSAQSWAGISGGTYNKTWDTASIAILEGTAGTITLTEPIAAKGIDFKVSGYIITGDTLTLNGSAPYINIKGGQTIRSVIKAENNLTFNGDNSTSYISLYGSNDFSKGITLDSGARLTLADVNQKATGASTTAGTITVLKNGSVITNGPDPATNSSIIENNIVLNPNNMSSPFVLAVGAGSGGGGGKLTYNGIISGNGDVIISSLVNGTGNGTYGGAGLTIFSNPANSYTGKTIIAGSTKNSCFQLGDNNAIPATTDVVFGNGTGSQSGAIDLNGFNVKVSSISSDSTIVAEQVNGITNAASVTATSNLTISGNKNTKFYGKIGRISPASSNGYLRGANSPSGNMSLTLDAANTGSLTIYQAIAIDYPTTVMGGALYFNDSLTSPTVLVGSNATIGGSGRGTGSLTLNGILSPGEDANSTANITFGEILINGGSYYKWDIANAASDWDSISATGTIDLSNLNSTSKLNILVTGTTVSGFADNQTYAWPIAKANSIKGFSADKFNINTAGFTPSFTKQFNVSADDSTIYLNYNAPTGIAQPAKGMISIYPNPNRGEDIIINIESTVISGSVTVEIKDILGNGVYTQNHPFATTLSIQPQNTLQTGLYFITVNDNNGNFYTHKLIIRK
ncbi:MAG: T9SS type A sorting domain-containing protein [Bacteroidetes bacterium]|nr:MAG: T9SS type A sorting domain-containing protein [Bacteroidota bacterium]